MDIFYQSDFYEKNSSNEELRSQNLPVTSDNLKNMKGIQFAVSKSIIDKELFWIEKRLRLSETKIEIVSAYYVVNFCIYQAPTLASIVDAKLNNAIFHTKKAYEILCPKPEE